MGIIVRNIKIVLVILCLNSFLVLSQDSGFETYMVEENETLSQISNKLKIPYSVLSNLNPDAKDNIFEGKVLVIPSITVINRNENLIETRLIKHIVKSSETLFSISQTYNITLEDILRYNKELENNMLKMGQVIKIAYTVDLTTSNKHIGEHTVKAGETKWSIAQQYAMSLNELHKLNPNLKDTIKPNEKINIYTKKETTKTVDKKDFIKHIVSKGETIWSISRRYNVHVNKIKQANNYNIKNIKTGSIIYIPKKIQQPQQRKKNLKTTPPQKTTRPSKPSYIWTTIQKNQTLYSLSKSYGINVEDLKKINPQIRNNILIRGMKLKIPVNKTRTYKSKPVKKVNLSRRFRNTDRPLKFGLILPFKLDNYNFEDKEKLKRQFESHKLLNYTLDFYSGVLVALDSLKKMGYDVAVKVFDSRADRYTINRLIMGNKFDNLDFIIGPFYPEPFNALSESLKSKNIPILSPLSNIKIRKKKNVILSVPNQSYLRAKILEYILKQNPKENNYILIYDDDNYDVAQKYKKRIPNLVEFPVPMYKKTVQIDSLSNKLSTDFKNIVIVETNDTPLLTNITSVLNSLKTEEYNIKMVTSSKGNAYEKGNISNYYLSNLEFCYPTINLPSNRYSKFSINYKKTYFDFPNKYAVRGFDITMDFIFRMAQHRNIEDALSLGETEYVENKFNYKLIPNSSFYNEATYIVGYKNLEIIKIE